MITDRYLPRYRRIEQALRERIATLRPGDALPSDAELCEQFGVSRMTARNAMERLREEGLIRRESGRGSFVAEPPSHRRANSLLNFSREMRRQGRVPSSRLLARLVRPATPDEAAALDLPPGGDVVELHRLRLADERPMAIERTVLHGRCAQVILDVDLEAGSLHQVLIDAGFVPTRGEATIRAEVAGPADASLLALAEGQPLLVERRLIRDQRGRPLEATESRYPAERYALQVAFEVQQVTAVDGHR
ncbi:MAG TPA: GntR family transcriptional regulator [Candidatus Limnocylindrales bacterium]